MPGGYKNIKGKDAQGFDKNPQNINRKGRPKKSPISDYLRKAVNTDGAYPIEAIRIKDAIIDDSGPLPVITIEGRWGTSQKGDKKIAFIVLDLPNDEAIAIQWVKDAKSGNSKIRTRARETLANRTEGMPVQPTLELEDEKELSHDEAILQLRELADAFGYELRRKRAKKIKGN